ncbi:hypothetical protein G9A89_013043 [Geosiphon pyriformis]|nr:hypothetical protein G9A89_013043 [Geosiphon pyriformis]
MRHSHLSYTLYVFSQYDEAFGYLKRVIVTPAVYPHLVEFLHFDIQSTGQKLHCINTTFWPSQCYGAPDGTKVSCYAQPSTLAPGNPIFQGAEGTVKKKRELFLGPPPTSALGAVPAELTFTPSSPNPHACLLVTAALQL